MPQPLVNGANEHAIRNSSSYPQQQRSIPGYSGPSIPDLRQDQNVSAIAQQVMGILMREIPALAAAPTAGPADPLHLRAAVPPQPAPCPPPPPSLPLFGGHLPSHHPADPASQHLEQLQRQLDQLRQARHLPQEHHNRLPQDHLQSQVASSNSNSVNLDFLLNASIKNKQFRSLDFAKIGNFPYINQVKQNNLNLALFAFGSFKHLLSLIDGTLLQVSQTELCSRLQHLCNVMDIVCLASSPSDFDIKAWKIGREYDTKIIQYIEHGFKNWETLDRCIDPTAWNYAKEILSKSKKINQILRQTNLREITSLQR